MAAYSGLPRKRGRPGTAGIKAVVSVVSRLAIVRSSRARMESTPEKNQAGSLPWSSNSRGRVPGVLTIPSSAARVQSPTALSRIVLGAGSVTGAGAATATALVVSAGGALAARVGSSLGGTAALALSQPAAGSTKSAAARRGRGEGLLIIGSLGGDDHRRGAPVAVAGANTTPALGKA